VTSGLLGSVVGQVRAVDDVSFTLRRGETLALVGESGCGKTTLGRTILRLEEPTNGRIGFAGQDITDLDASAMRTIRRDMQMVFQDPQSSLNPRMTVGDIVGEALRVHGVTRGSDTLELVEATLERVGLSGAWMHRYPHEFSGGQRQRIGIARAIVLEPKLIVCDEAVSALDVSIQAQVLNLLIELRDRMDLSYLFIAHDLSVVRHIADRVAVMYLGQLVEVAPTEVLFQNAAHPYTRALLSAIPIRNPRKRAQRIVLEGDVPSPQHPPSGCRFHTRCPAVMDRCRREAPPSFDLGGGHGVTCFLAEDGMADWHLAPRPNPPVVHRREMAPSSSPRRAEHRMPIKRIAAIAIFAVGLALLGTELLERHARPTRAEEQHTRLLTEIARAAELRGALPDGLRDLGWRLLDIFPDGRPLDPWGRSWRYRVIDPEAMTFAVGSVGPDGQPGGEDDVGEL